MIRMRVPPNGKFWFAPIEHERDQRDERDEAEVDRAGQRDAGQHVVEVLGGRPPGTDARDEAAVLLHVVGDLIRVEGDRDVEVA